MKLRPSVLNPEWRTALATRVVNRLAKWAGVKTAVLAGYKAGEVSRTRQLHTNYGTNPNTSMAQVERVRMQWTGEFLAKNVPFVTAYLKTRAMYCAPLAWVPNTGDTKLDEELAEYLREHWEDGGINCSMWDAFTRTVDCEQPVRGDAGLIWYRDENRYRLMEFSADQLGELWTFQNPYTGLNGTTYFAGRFFAPNGQCVAYRIYQRGFNQVYCSPENYDAADVLYFQDNLFRGVRGITTFHSAILSVEKADRLFQSGMDAATKQASREGFVFNERGQPDEGTYETDQYLDGSVTYFQRAMDGTTTEYMFKGDSYQAMEPTMPGEELIKGVESAKEEACLALGFPYSFLVNATKVGGAPSRLEVNRAGKEITRLHRARMSALERIAYVTIMDAVDRGYFPPIKSIDKGHWQFPNLPTADAFRDAKDDVMSLRYGLDSAQRILGRYGESFPVILEENTQAAIAIAKKVQDANRQLERDGYEPTITAVDVAQRTENPQQAATAEMIIGEDGKPIPKAQESTKQDGKTQQPQDTENIQATALNGAQVTALAQLASDVSNKVLPYETAVSIARAAFPEIPEATLQKIFGPLKSFTPQPEVPASNGATPEASVSRA